jgi:transglutaminase-like putative cysteine protease
VRYLIEHRMEVTFAEGPVREHHCELRMVPRDDGQQRLLGSTVNVQPENEMWTWQDAFGNRVHCFSLLPHHEHVTIETSSEVQTRNGEPAASTPLSPAMEDAWLAETIREQPRLLAYLYYRSPSTPLLPNLAHELDFAVPGRDPAQPLTDAIHQAMQWIAGEMQYMPQFGVEGTALEAALQHKTGDCQAFAHLMISIARGWGIPARYVTGYRAEPLRDTESSSYGLYAWTEILVPGKGWQGFDAVRRAPIDASYIAVACGRDSHDAAPRRGVFKGQGKEPVMPKIDLRVVPQ